MIKLVLTAEAIKENRKVINPLTMLRVDERGVDVRKVDSYWRARIKDKDVEIQKASKTEKAK